MLLPSKRLLQLLIVMLLIAMAGSYFSPWPAIWQISLTLLLTIALIDGIWLLWLRNRLEVARSLPNSLAVGVSHEVKLTLHHHYPFTIQIAILDDCPIDFESDQQLAWISLHKGEHVSLSYHLKPLSRGRHELGSAYCKLSSPLRLWQRYLSCGETTPLNIYPNFAAIVRYSLLATDHRLGQLGVLLRQRRGEGLDFRQLREYREGDTQRQIDWKASSRMRKLISREYQDERDQQVMFMLDCGRRMQAKDGELSHFDHTLNAMLLLSYVALRQGDAVGLSTFGTSAQRFLQPKKSDSTVNLILNQVFDLQPTLQTSDYYQAAIDLSLRLNKRSLIIVLSNLRDEDDTTIMPALSLLRKKHLVVFASLTESSLLETMNLPIQDEKSAIQFAANCDFLNRRENMLQQLNHSGTIALETPPEKLAIELVNQYLDLKMSSRF